MTVTGGDADTTRVLALALMRQTEEYLTTVGEQEALLHLQRSIEALLKSPLRNTAPH